MRVGIMGLGFVGTAMKSILETKHHVYCYDPVKEGYRNPEVLRHAELIFVCVGTPMREDSTVNMDYINSAINTIKELKTKPAVFIKSTVPPKTCYHLSLLHELSIGSNPEFLRERCAVRDMWASDRIIMGGTEWARERLKSVYYPIFGDDVEYVEVTSTEAEMIKHTTNAFLASQVGFANEIYNMCKIFDINYDKIKHALYLDKRLGRHIDVPGTDGKLGFGGHCLTKDLNALANHSESQGYPPTLFKELLRFNEVQRDE